MISFNFTILNVACRNPRRQIRSEFVFGRHCYTNFNCLQMYQPAPLPKQLPISGVGNPSLYHEEVMYLFSRPSSVSHDVGSAAPDAWKVRHAQVRYEAVNLRFFISRQNQTRSPPAGKPAAFEQSSLSEPVLAVLDSFFFTYLQFTTITRRKPPPLLQQAKRCMTMMLHNVSTSLT